MGLAGIGSLQGFFMGIVVEVFGVLGFFDSDGGSYTIEGSIFCVWLAKEWCEKIVPSEFELFNRSCRGNQKPCRNSSKASKHTGP